MQKTEPKRGRGRPPAPAGHKREQVTFRLNQIEQAQLDHAAALRGTTRTEYIRQVALDASARDIAERTTA